jgi:hypothetical protein
MKTIHKTLVLVLILAFIVGCQGQQIEQKKDASVQQQIQDKQTTTSTTTKT